MRRKLKSKKALKADYKYNSEKITKLVNYVMYDGKKSVAERAVYDMLDLIAEKAKVKNPVEVLELALSMKWIVEAARTKKGAPISAKLADEIIAASKNEGEAVRKKENTHKMAEANKAFAHFAW